MSDDFDDFAEEDGTIDAPDHVEEELSEVDEVVIDPNPENPIESEFDTDGGDEYTTEIAEEWENEFTIDDLDEEWSQPQGRQKIFPFDDEDVGYIGSKIIRSPEDAYFQMVDESIFEMIATETNRYAEQLLKAKTKEIARSSKKKTKKRQTLPLRLQRWKPTDANEIKNYFGIVLFFGTSRVSWKLYFYYVGTGH